MSDFLMTLYVCLNNLFICCSPDAMHALRRTPTVAGWALDGRALSLSHGRQRGDIMVSRPDLASGLP